MTTALVCAAGALLVWAIGSRVLHRVRVSLPLMMVLAGVILSAPLESSIGLTLNTAEAERVAEIILALILFVDATEVRGGPLGHSPRTVLRLLLIALPVSLVAATVVGSWFFDDVSWPALLVIAAIVMPTDFAPASSILKDARLPERLRSALNVESGFNDGIVAPVFAFAMVLAGSTEHAASPLAAMQSAVPALAIAVASGLAIGLAAAVLVNVATARGWTTTGAVRIGMLALPLLAYAVAVSFHGNGFVAAFVTGVTWKALRRVTEEASEAEVRTVDDVTFVASLLMWFVFGAVGALFLTLADLPLFLFTLLALTVLRLVPVLLSLVGSPLPMSERVVLGLLGPRGTASIVFGLLAYNGLTDPEDSTALALMMATVGGSLVLHGMGAATLGAWMRRKSVAAAPTAT